jgi:hypothetical protein
MRVVVVAVALIVPASSLNFRIENNKLAERQFATAAATSRAA